MAPDNLAIEIKLLIEVENFCNSKEEFLQHMLQNIELNSTCMHVCIDNLVDVELTGIINSVTLESIVVNENPQRNGKA
ncbi:MAG: hypothetical protein KatS3mg031_2892 [Chitinophagales bacterium]|nr:MAG: hypothetical protein KatS3mg031_2892 [Chitinophagales bacterium]